MTAELDEESSMAIIAIRQDVSSHDLRQKHTQSSLLPQINDGKKICEVFTDETPDTKGVLHKRFVEIIESDDETNGNGTQMRRRFRNQRDAFGDDIASPIAEARIDEEQASPEPPIGKRRFI